MRKALQLNSVGITRETKHLLKDVDLSIEQGEMVALIGRNGAGKSTLLRAILGLIRITEGAITIDGRSTQTLNGPERGATFGWLPQVWKVDEPISLLEFVCSARYRFNESRSSTLAASQQALRKVGLTTLAQRSMTTLSGGEAQRATLAALIAQNPAYWLLDEPANHLDPAQQFSVYEFIAHQWRQGRTTVCVTHDIGLLYQFALANPTGDFRILGMDSGKVAFDLFYRDRELRNALEKLFGVEMQILCENGLSRFIPLKRNGGKRS